MPLDKFGSSLEEVVAANSHGYVSKESEIFAINALKRELLRKMEEHVKAQNKNIQNLINNSNQTVDALVTAFGKKVDELKKEIESLKVTNLRSFTDICKKIAEAKSNDNKGKGG